MVFLAWIFLDLVFSFTEQSIFFYCATKTGTIYLVCKGFCLQLKQLRISFCLSCVKSLQGKVSVRNYQAPVCPVKVKASV